MNDSKESKDCKYVAWSGSDLLRGPDLKPIKKTRQAWTGYAKRFEPKGFNTVIVWMPWRNAYWIILRCTD